MGLGGEAGGMGVGVCTLPGTLPGLMVCLLTTSRTRLYLILKVNLYPKKARLRNCGFQTIDIMI